MKIKTNTPSLLSVLESLDQVLASMERNVQALDKDGALSALCVEYLSTGSAYEALDERRLRLYNLKDKMSKVLIPEALGRAGLDKVSVPEVGHSFYILDKYSASMVDRDKAMEWLRKNKAASLITETVNAGTLAAFLKEKLLKEGVDPPESIRFTEYKITGTSKYTPKGGE